MIVIQNGNCRIAHINGKPVVIANDKGVTKIYGVYPYTITKDDFSRTVGERK